VTTPQAWMIWPENPALSILVLALIFQSLAGLINLDLGRLFLFALPGTIAGAWLGRRLYNRLSDRRFDNAVLSLLLISGFLLLLSLLR